MPKRIPIAEAQGCKQVVLTAWDGNLVHIVSYGVTKEDCRQAARGAKAMKDWLRSKSPTELVMYDGPFPMTLQTPNDPTPTRETPAAVSIDPAILEVAARAYNDAELAQEGKPPVSDDAWNNGVRRLVERTTSPFVLAALTAAAPLLVAGERESALNDDALIGKIALLFHDAMSVKSEPSSYAMAVITAVFEAAAIRQ